MVEKSPRVWRLSPRLLEVAAVAALFLWPDPAGAARAELRDMRPIVAADHTRLVLDLGKQVDYRLQAMPADDAAGVPARLYVELDETRLGDSFPRRWAPSGGPVQRMRAAQLPGGMTRLIIDVPGLYFYNAFPLLDPFRLVVDARGKTRPVADEIPRPISDTVAQRPTDESPPLLPTSVSRSKAAPAPPSPPLTIALDPGHGGKDPGAESARGVLEKDVVLHIARALARRLEEDGYRVVLTRDRDVFVPLNDRTARANKAGADLFVSIHANASRNLSASGIETYYLSNTNDRATIRLARMENHLAYMAGGHAQSPDVSYIVSDMIQRYKVGESRHFARLIQRSLVERARVPNPSVFNLGVKPGPFAVLVGAGMPAVLVEVSFLSNPEEGKKLEDEQYREAIAEGILRGITQFGLASRIASTL